MSSKIPVSVLIPAKNEEANLPACLTSLQPADEIFIVDSQSTDNSAEIAQSYGANVVQFKFNGRWPKKKNWSLDNLPFRNEWVLIVDCDERITPELWSEIAQAIQNQEYAGYYLNRRVFFLGKWIRHGGKYPDWNLRLFKHKQGRYENLNTEDIPNTGDNEVHESRGELLRNVFCCQFIVLKEASDEQKNKVAPIIHPGLKFIPLRLHGADPAGGRACHRRLWSTNIP